MSVERKCKDCSKNISHLHYNCVRCKTCQFYHRRDKKLKATQEWKKRKFGVHSKMSKLGTTDFSEHANTDFIEELKEIRFEMRRLGLIK